MEIVEILALLYLAGKAGGGGKGCAEFQKNMGSLMVISPSFRKIPNLGL